MSGSAHRGDDDIAYFEAAIEETVALAATVAGAQTTDNYGALTPGRWLIQAQAFSVATALCWVQVGAFVKGSPISLASGAGLKKYPLSDKLPAIEFNIRKGVDDRVGVIMSAGTADVLLSRVSRTSKGM